MLCCDRSSDAGRHSNPHHNKADMLCAITPPALFDHADHTLRGTNQLISILVSAKKSYSVLLTLFRMTQVNGL